jgi:hypothetical protein
VTGRCPVCTMVCPAWPSPDPGHAGLVRLRMHTWRGAAHLPPDLLAGPRDLLMICIGTRADVRPAIVGSYMP